MAETVEKLHRVSFRTGDGMGPASTLFWRTMVWYGLAGPTVIASSLFWMVAMRSPSASVLPKATPMAWAVGISLVLEGVRRLRRLDWRSFLVHPILLLASGTVALQSMSGIPIPNPSQVVLLSLVCAYLAWLVMSRTVLEDDLAWQILRHGRRVDWKQLELRAKRGEELLLSAHEAWHPIGLRRISVDDRRITKIVLDTSAYWQLSSLIAARHCEEQNVKKLAINSSKEFGSLKRDAFHVFERLEYGQFGAWSPAFRVGWRFLYESLVRVEALEYLLGMIMHRRRRGDSIFLEDLALQQRAFLQVYDHILLPHATRSDVRIFLSSTRGALARSLKRTERLAEQDISALRPPAASH